MNKSYKEVCIFGTAPSRVNAPENIESWGTGYCPVYIKRTFSKVFEIHKDLPSEHIKRLSDYDCTVYAQEKLDIKNSKVFPYEELTEYFKDYNGQYFYTSTIAFMIAYAIYLNYDIIHLYGADCREEDGYRTQREAITYWVGVAEGKGVKVNIAKSSELFKIPYIYAYEKENEIVLRAIIRNEQLVHELKKLKTEYPENIDKMNKLKGAIQQNNEWIRLYSYD